MSTESPPQGAAARAGARKGTLLRFYVHERRLHRHVALFEWLLEQARALGIGGGSAFRAIAGFGRHGVLHEEHFYELAGDLAIAVEFIVTPDQADALIGLLEREALDVPYVAMPVEFGVVAGSR
jgi:PII-like signaling protein